MKTKKCNKCSEEKELICFRVRKDSKDGFGNRCKICESEMNKFYRENNKEKIKIKNDRFLEKNKDYFKKRYEDNKETFLMYFKENYEKNKDVKLNYDKIYRSNNKEKIKEKQKKWYLENREKIILKQNDNYKNRLINDPLFKLRRAIKNNIYHAIKKSGLTKKSKTQEILGCKINCFKTYLESKFEPWMNWDNYGKYNGELNYGWDLDHITPISSAKTEEDVIRLNHYSNLRPLCSYTNRCVKKDNIITVNKVGNISALSIK